MLDPRLIHDMTVSRIRQALADTQRPSQGVIDALKNDRRTSVKAMGERIVEQLKQRRQRLETLWRYETEVGGGVIAGVDEAGRGPLAGPVCAAAVILPHGLDIPGLANSKVMKPENRETVFDVIFEQSIAVGLAFVDVETIDRLNILRASMKAMRSAIEDLGTDPEMVLIDGDKTPGSQFAERAIVKGDSKSMSIAAASVIAKVSRDRHMALLDEKYSGYGFVKHKGYGTPEHLEALRKLGACPEHRRSFGYVADVEAGRSDDFFDFNRGISAAQSQTDLEVVGEAVALVSANLGEDELVELRRRYAQKQARLKQYRDDARK
ncbi:MAG: ribonuclease HII [Candidatus Latescibacteria bacterium]|nr:ribonuclease HII [Candidatus Latescibacterota bacterium]